MSTHHLKLATVPFEAIKSRTKTIESRLYDEKRQAIGLGDQLIFTNREQPDQTIAARVIGLLRYASFEDLFRHNEPTKFGGSSVAWLLDQISEFYPAQVQEEYSVIGIEFELL